MPAIAVIGAVSGVVGAVGAIQSANAQRRAVRLQQQQQDVATRRSRRQTIRQAMISRAQAISGAANLGALGGSGLAGGLSSLGSQVGSEMGFSTQMSGLSRDITSAQMSAMRWGAISNLGFSAFNALGGWDNARGIFGGSNGGGMSPSAALAPGAGTIPTAAWGARPTQRPTSRALPINSANPYGFQ